MSILGHGGMVGEGQDEKPVVPTEPASSCTMDTVPIVLARPYFDSERETNKIHVLRGVGSGLGEEK